MKKLILFSFLIILSGCKSVPVTGRNQLNLLPGSEMRSMASNQYNQVLDTAQVVRGTEESQMLKTVGEEIKNAVQRYLRENDRLELLEGYQWEFTLIKNDDMVNAWAMPGGKIAFYTGILPICQDANGVAVVMAHEIAHAVARHGNERMSQGLLTQLGGVALQVALRDKQQQTQQLAMAAYGLGSQVGVLLPYSRTHESEADHMGLIFMAMAGYDPREAPELWKRMAARSGGAQPPEFLSTHPSHETRIENLNEWMDEAMKYYRGNPLQENSGEEG